MRAKITSGATVGLNAVLVDVEVDIQNGLPSFTIVGLPDKAVEESRERVRSAIKNSGADFPTTRITVNLAPADLPKVGPAYDLPIALGILVASEQLVLTDSEALYVGELSLDGSLRHTNGILSLAMLTKTYDANHMYVPAIDAPEASIIQGIKIYPVFSLLPLFHHPQQTEAILPQKHMPFEAKQERGQFDFDMADV